jgi:hypothetical protein
MRVVRQWMIKSFKDKLPLGSLILFLPLLGILSSCNPTELTGKGVQGSVIANDGSYEGKAYIYPDSPYALGGANYSVVNPNMGKFLDRQAHLVTENNKLTGNCTIYFTTFPTTITDCIRSLKDGTSDQDIPRKADGTFIFPVGSPEFYQTNTLYHLTLATNKFLEKLGTVYSMVRTSTSTRVPKSIPAYLQSSKLFWFRAITNAENKLFKNDSLTSFSQCDVQHNSLFSPVGPSLCFGSDSTIPGFLFVQDPSIVYHELGHAFVAVMMNLRNGTSASSYHPLRSNLGSYGYDEAGSIGEGIADYQSYLMNKREVFGEFALGTAYAAARPISEASSLHITGIDETSEGRLSYPQYLNYDTKTPDKVKEDVHNAGQIMSHYLVALTKEFKNQCNLSSEPDGGHEKATTYVTLLLAETLSELGDLNARGIDYSTGTAISSGSSIYFTNMDSTNSYLWSQVINQITYRRFSQVFAKNINKYITGIFCTGFTRNESEKLLDDYGLLLFKTYNDNGNSTKNRSTTYTNIDSNYSINTPTAPTAVAEDNRRKSVLVSKQLLDLAARSTEFPNRASFYVIDGGAEMQSLLKELLFKGFPVPLSTSVASTVYNNGNLKLSPGEVVAIIPNLLNKSNSTMGGVQLLANDWDHVDITDQATGNFKPCVVDTVTTVDQGGQAANTCSTTSTSYQRLIKNSSTGLFPAEAAAPVCMVQMEDGSSSKWVSQNEFRKKQGLSLQDKDCLGYSTSSTSDTDFTFNPHECLVRFLPGASDAFYSKIEPQKTYYESTFSSSDNVTFNAGNILMLEINKWIPPGTKFRCRLRARFSNCSDCYNDDTNSKDDFLDHELSGSKPFKVINFDFDVND